MKLTKIKIENFRSIKSQTIVIDHNCLILLGKNEAGKSNIIKAIAAVFDKYKVSDKDKRKRIDNETIKEYYVRAIIKLSEDDFEEIFNRIKRQYTNIEGITFKNGKTFYDFIKTVFYEFLICIDIADNRNPHFSYWAYSGDNFELDKEIYLNGVAFNIEEAGEKQEFKDLISITFEIIKKVYNETPYICHYWQYSENYLLQNSIDISDFISTPKKHPLLYNIFMQGNPINIAQEFNDAKSQDGDYENLLDRVSKSVTKIFQGIWKDLKDTSIELRQNNTEILIKIVGKTKFSIGDRSDGFKKFISILLMLSTQARSKQIGDRDIILIDEPDQSLYPTSVEYLRNELLKISKNAKVIYTTHSPYMIDSKCIERHLIVEKHDDVTTISRQDQNAPFSNDELLRRAVGSSIFEIIKSRNIIFEGWLDKELFFKYRSFNEDAVNFDLNQIGTVYLGGISGVEALVQLLILANKKFIIVADSDSTSKNKRKAFEENYEEFASSWLAYGDEVPDILTMEDFIDVEVIKKCIQKESPDFEYEISKKAIENIENAVKDDKEKKQRIKKAIVDNLQKDDINASYSQFVIKLNSMIDNL